MTETRLTPGEMRTNAQKIADENLKQAVLDGIEVITKHYGPDWVEKIHLPTLTLDNGVHCVLGQVYRGAPMTDAAGEEMARLGYEEQNEDDWEDMEGYERGLAILDGDVLDQPERFGFNIKNWGDPSDLPGTISWTELQEAWYMVFGLEPGEYPE